MAARNANVCVFCGSSDGTSPAFLKAATELGERLAEEGFGLVYGAGDIGLMNAVADGVLRKGGRVMGFIPKAMDILGWTKKGLTRTVITKHMHARKRKMYKNAFALVTLPGGIGTMDEFFESFTWSQLGYHSKQLFVLNIDGFYEPLRVMLDHMVESGFVCQGDRGLVKFIDSVSELVAELVLLDTN